MSLRERKRRKTVRALLDAAGALMSERGYEATSVEAVAARAEVSVGTLYNHFDSKQALLLALYVDATADVLALAEPLVAAPPDDPLVAVLDLMRLYARELSRLDRALLRQAIAVSLTATPEVEAEMMGLDVQLMGQTAALVATLQARGALAPLPVEAVTVTLYGTFMVAMLWWIAMPGADTASLERSLEEQLNIVFRGLLPANTPREAT
ncbi:MAG: TetR/AcrR family transcriptional regulator [Myxococcota bacterium]